MYAVHLGGGVLVLLLYFALDHWTNPVLTLLVVLVTGVVWYVPIYNSGPVRTTYTTDKSPSRVCEEFTSDCPPMIALRCYQADDVSHRSNDDGTAIEYYEGSDTIRYEMESTGTGGIAGTITKNGERYGAYTVSIDDGDETTAIELEYEPAHRFNVMRLALYLAIASIDREMMRLQGCEPESTGLITV